jgi:hypothetical protein
MHLRKDGSICVCKELLWIIFDLEMMIGSAFLLLLVVGGGKVMVRWRLRAHYDFKVDIFYVVIREGSFFDGIELDEIVRVEFDKKG